MAKQRKQEDEVRFNDPKIQGAFERLHEARAEANKLKAKRA